MKITLPLVLETIHAMAMALWVGGQAAVIIILGIPGDSRIFLTREQAVVEVAGIAMVGIQYLTRRRYLKVRPLFLADAVRHLLTFASLLLAEYVKYVIKVKPGSPATETDAMIAAAQIGMLTVVSAITMWLISASARMAPAAVETVNATAPVVPAANSTGTRPRLPKAKRR